MPNQIYFNELWIEGNYQELEQPYWIAQPKSSDLIANNYLFAAYLEQKNLEEDKLKQWRIKNWGCENDPLIKFCDRGRFQTRIIFTSINYPPLGGIKKLSLRFPQNTFEYFYKCKRLNIKASCLIQNGKTLNISRTSYFGRPSNCQKCSTLFRPELSLKGSVIDCFCLNCQLNWQKSS